MGPDKSIIQKQSQLTDAQIGMAQQQQQASAVDKAESRRLMQPEISKLFAISSGDRNTAFASLAPQLSEFTRAADASRGQIMENLPPGAGRDFALAQVMMGQQDAKARTLANEFSTAPTKLANIGSGLGSFSLNEVAAAMGGFNNAANSNSQVAQMQAARAAGILGIIGSLAGAAGNFASGGLAKILH